VLLEAQDCEPVEVPRCVRLLAANRPGQRHEVAVGHASVDGEGGLRIGGPDLGHVLLEPGGTFKVAGWRVVDRGGGHQQDADIRFPLCEDLVEEPGRDSLVGRRYDAGPAASVFRLHDERPGRRETWGPDQSGQHEHDADQPAMKAIPGVVGRLLVGGSNRRMVHDARQGGTKIESRAHVVAPLAGGPVARRASSSDDRIWIMRRGHGAHIVRSTALPHSHKGTNYVVGW